MTYSEIISNNASKAPIPWWTNFAFHYTDVTNAINIISTGYLYSRSKALKTKNMKNDNASLQVINMTESTITSSVRFYFRPLTPTQYNNEGFKHAKLRYQNDVNANVPVPVFFLFDLKKLMNNPAVKFSEFSKATHNTDTLSGEDDFSKLNFEKIYSTGYVDNEDLKYRHAEIIYPIEYKIEDSLKYIICRNEAEKTTLLTLLKNENSTLFYKYKNMIKIATKELYENNGLFIESIVYTKKSVKFNFSDTYDKEKYDIKTMDKNGVSSLCDIFTIFKFKWINGNTVLSEKSSEYKIDYRKPPSLVFNNLPVIESAKKLQISVFFEGSLIHLSEYSLDDAELI